MHITINIKQVAKSPNSFEWEGEVKLLRDEKPGTVQTVGFVCTGDTRSDCLSKITHFLTVYAG